MLNASSFYHSSVHHNFAYNIATMFDYMQPIGNPNNHARGTTQTQDNVLQFIISKRPMPTSDMLNYARFL